MKAIVYEQYGGPEVLKLAEVEKPQPKADEVLVEVHASAVNAADWRLMRAEPFLVRFETGLFKPKRPILGADLAGRVVEIGQNVTRFKPGDEVFGDLSDCGSGCFAEYVCAPAAILQLKPSNLTFEEAAALPMAGGTALQAWQTGAIQAGQSVLINGASGGVGSYLVQIAKAHGANVTAVCSSRKVEFVKSLGADHVIDYKKEDFTQNGKQYDLIIAVNGYQKLAAYQRSLTPSGRYVVVGGPLKQLFGAMLFGGWVTRGTDQTITTLMAKSNPDDLATLKQWAEAGTIKPRIDNRYPLSQTADAVAYLNKGNAKGKVVITVTN